MTRRLSRRRRWRQECSRRSRRRRRTRWRRRRKADESWWWVRSEWLRSLATGNRMTTLGVRGRDYKEGYGDRKGAARPTSVLCHFHLKAVVQYLVQTVKRKPSLSFALLLSRFPPILTSMISVFALALSSLERMEWCVVGRNHNNNTNIVNSQ